MDEERRADGRAGPGGGRVDRRAFLRGAVGTAGAVILGTGLWVAADREAAVPPRPAPPGGWDDAQPLFRQDRLADDDAVYTSGGRRSTADTAGYASPAVPKATIVADGRPRLRLPGPEAGLVLPAAGLLPRRGWTATLAARNVADVDLAELDELPEPAVLLTAGPVVLWLLGTGELTATSFATGQQAARPLAAGDWPPGAWRRVTVGWGADGPTLWLALGADGERIEADPPDAPPPARALVPGGRDDGLVLGGAPLADPPVEIAGTEIVAGGGGPAAAPEQPPRLAIDADRRGAPWAPGRSGVLALYAGFRLGATSSEPEQRDRQFALVFDEAGSLLVRFGGALNLAGVRLDAGGEPTLAPDALDAELDAALADREGLALHLTLDYTPPALQPAGGDHRSPPTDPEAWAGAAAAVVAHVARRYGSRLASVTLWNEPDLDEYWTGSDEELYDLWARTQRRLLEADHGLRLGNPEYATTAGFEGFFAWLADQPERLRRSVDAVYVHDFQQDLREVRQRLAAARAAAEAAGVGPVPLRITEYNLALAQLRERRQDEDSWYRTQPPHFTSEYAAAFALHFLWEALEEDEDVDTAVFAAIGTPALFWGEQALTTSEGEIRPHPALGTIALLARLAGERIAATSTLPAVRALATVDDDGVVRVAYASFRPYRGFVDDVTVALSWSGLPDAFAWRHWQLDRHHDDDGRLALVGEGDADDLPGRVRIGALGIGGFEIVPA